MLISYCFCKMGGSKTKCVSVCVCVCVCVSVCVAGNALYKITNWGVVKN